MLRVPVKNLLYFFPNITFPIKLLTPQKEKLKATKYVAKCKRLVLRIKCPLQKIVRLVKLFVGNNHSSRKSEEIWKNLATFPRRSVPQ